MAITPVAGAGTTGATTTTSTATTDEKNSTINYDSFLKLLIAQMKNQDPTDPIDASEQMSQLASFSQVEQSIKTNKHLENLISETTLGQAASLVGKTVTSSDGTVTGVVNSVDINSDAVTATLTNGETMLIQTGITVSQTAGP